MEEQIKEFKKKVAFTVHEKHDFYVREEYIKNFFLRILPVTSIIITLLLFFSVPLRVASFSMEPTLVQGDLVLVERFTLLSTKISNYLLPERGSLMVYRDPRQERHPYVVKRIVGMPSEKLNIQNDIVSVTNKYDMVTSFEPDSLLGRKDNGIDKEIPLTENDYLLLGDNRAGSKDGRLTGPIQLSEMYGKVYFRVWPLSRFGPVF